MAATGERGRVLADRYELRDKLGHGGAGTVWRGHDRALDRPVAVKLLHADLAGDRAAGTRFRTEATAAAKLTHPNAVLVYDLGQDLDETYLVMELVEGVNLGDILDDGPLPAGLAAALGAQVASALGTAHAAGIVHRDVKPANVLVTVDGAAKLADFGIARALGAATSRLTRTGTVLGTARYLAPEQLRDDPIDARADVYALGLVLHEALTGRAPFGEGNAVEVAARRLTTVLPHVSDLMPGIPPGLEEVIEWSTRVDPRERPTDGNDLADALRAFASRGADTAIAARVARVPQRNTTPVASERIAPIDVAGSPPEPLDAPPAPPVDPGVPLDPGGDAAPADEPPIGSTRAIPVTDTAGGAAAVPAAPRDATSAYSELPGDEATAAPAGPSTGRRWLVGVVAAIAVLLGAIALNAANDGTLEPGDDAGTPTASGDAEGEPLPVAASGDLDPEGDLREHGDQVENAHDGDADTFWPTETYRSSDFSGLPKSGVGIWLELEEPQALDRVEVELNVAGGSLELYASDQGPPDDEQLPGDWGTRLGGGEVPDARLQFPNLPRGEIRTVVLWFTDLPESSRSGWRAEVRDVRLIGR
ncbi:protein kinase domain-containing protein [Nitriliruptor alkaliphilus]|uniref:protein kinase domain-containing protein n=1 Tax=Nitriliruptor alkaliphilus TaxID=427918 RepID=UPI0012ED3A38|nr:protein kinase [Nitriliruptor alkaliphilus]